MPSHVRQVAGLFPSARGETRRCWKPFSGDFRISRDSMSIARHKVFDPIAKFGRGVVNIVASPYYHYSDQGSDTGYAAGKKQISESAQTVATMAILTAYGISNLSGPSSPSSPVGTADTPYSNLSGSIDMPYGENYPGVQPTPAAPELASPSGMELEAASGTGQGEWVAPELSPSYVDTALSTGKYLGEKIGLPLALKLLSPSSPAVAGGGGYSIYNQSGGSDGGGSGSDGGGGGFFSGFDQPGALGLPMWATYAIAALILGAAIAASNKKG